MHRLRFQPKVINPPQSVSQCILGSPFFLHILASVRELEKPFIIFPGKKAHLLLTNGGGIWVLLQAEAGGP